MVLAAFLAVLIGGVEVRAKQGSGEAADQYRHVDGKWTVSLPAGWKVMPAEMLSAMNAGAGELASRAGEKVRYVAGFFKGNALTGRWSWVLVQDNTFGGKGKLPRDLSRVLDVEGLKKGFMKMEEAGVKTEILSSIVDGENGKAVVEIETEVPASGDRVVGRINLSIGSQGVLGVSGYSSKELWGEYERDVATICSSATYVGANHLNAADRAVEGEDLAYRMGQVVGTVIMLLLVLGAFKGIKKLRGG